MCRKMFSSTTIASSMTMPTASVRPSSVMLFSVKSMARISVNVAMIDAGIASDEMMTARMLRMKNMTTSGGQQAAPEQVLFERGDRRVDEPRVVAHHGQRDVFRQRLADRDEPRLDGVGHPDRVLARGAPHIELDRAAVIVVEERRLRLSGRCPRRARCRRS